MTQKHDVHGIMWQPMHKASFQDWDLSINKHSTNGDKPKSNKTR